MPHTSALGMQVWTMYCSCSSFCKEVAAQCSAAQSLQMLVSDKQRLVLQEAMTEAAKQSGASGKAVGKLNNVLMQMRKNANHPGMPTFACLAAVACSPAASACWQRCALSRSTLSANRREA